MDTKKRIFTILGLVTLLVGIACGSVSAAETSVIASDEFLYPSDPVTDLQHVNGPGYPGGIFLTTSAESAADSFYNGSSQFGYIAIFDKETSDPVFYPWSSDVYLESNGDITFHVSLEVETFSTIRFWLHGFESWQLRGMYVRYQRQTAGHQYLTPHYPVSSGVRPLPTPYSSHYGYEVSVLDYIDEFSCYVQFSNYSTDYTQFYFTLPNVYSQVTYSSDFLEDVQNGFEYLQPNFFKILTIFFGAPVISAVVVMWGGYMVVSMIERWAH